MTVSGKVGEIPRASNKYQTAKAHHSSQRAILAAADTRCCESVFPGCEIECNQQAQLLIFQTDFLNRCSRIFFEGVYFPTASLMSLPTSPRMLPAVASQMGRCTCRLGPIFRRLNQKLEVNDRNKNSQLFTKTVNKENEESCACELTVSALVALQMRVYTLYMRILIPNK